MDAERKRDNRASDENDSGRADSGQETGKEKRADSGASGNVYRGTVQVAIIH